MAKRKPAADAVFTVQPFGMQVALFSSRKEMARYHEVVLGVSDHGIDGATIAGALASIQYDGSGAPWFSMWLPKRADPGTIVHECSHMVDMAMDTHGVPISMKNTEIRAYMLQRLFEDVSGFMAQR